MGRVLMWAFFIMLTGALWIAVVSATEDVARITWTAIRGAL